MIVQKKALNEIRGALRRELASTERYIKNGERNLSGVHNESPKSNNIAAHFDGVNGINNLFQTKFGFFEKKEVTIDCFEKKLDKARNRYQNIRALISAFGKDGVNVVTYSFPIFCSLKSDNEQIQMFLAIIGIKYNGENVKSKDKIDELERNLYSYEMEMAKLIQDDFTIRKVDIEAFKRIYAEYIRYYYLYNEDIMDTEKTDIQQTINKMVGYLEVNEEIVRSIKMEWEEEQGKERITIEKDPVVRMLGSTLKRTKPESKALNEKEQLNQPIIERLERRTKKLEEIVTIDALELYSQAKVSGNINATKTIKDIDAAIELLLESNDENEKENLIFLINKYFDYLKDLLIQNNVEKDTDKDLFQLYYSTNNYDNPNKCHFVNDLKKIRLESLNGILKYLMELKSGVIAPSKLKRLTDCSGCFEIKCDQIRIVYKPIEENKIVILGVFIKKDDNDIEMYTKLTGRSTELMPIDYNMRVEEYLEEYVKENARNGNRK